MMIMKLLNIVVFIGAIVTSFAGNSQLEGTWQGIIIRAGQPMEKGNVLYADFNVSDGVLTGYMREEIYETDYFGLRQLTGKTEGNTLNFKQTVLENQKAQFRSKWCLNDGSLTYDSVTGYLSGAFSSSNCGRFTGKIILYRNDFELSTADTSSISHIWFDRFIKDYKDGLNAPEIRKIERDNFVFEPIFFDFDKAEIRPEHEEFLNSMIKIVKGHPDLRVLVTGHTDAEGSNGYNDGLSKRRAEAIVNYFVKHGLSEDRLKFDFKGETVPAATNDTPEGRQRNRRVDFKFI